MDYPIKYEGRRSGVRTLYKVRLIISEHASNYEFFEVTLNNKVTGSFGIDRMVTLEMSRPQALKTRIDFYFSKFGT